MKTLPVTNTWFGINPVRGPARDRAGRGKAEDATRLVALFADLDFKTEGCGNPAVALAIIDDLSAILNTPPATITESGYGLQPYWPVHGHLNAGMYKRPVADAGTCCQPRISTVCTNDNGVLLRRWGRLVAAVADKHGAKVDNVYDMARVLRVPGTYNCKKLNGKEPVLVVCHPIENGKVLSLREVDDALRRHGIREEPEDRRNREPLSSLDRWKFAEKTCPYVAKIVAGLPQDGPKNSGRHQWMLSQQVRLCSAWRLGCISVGRP